MDSRDGSESDSSCDTVVSKCLFQNSRVSNPSSIRTDHDEQLILSISRLERSNEGEFEEQNQISNDSELIVPSIELELHGDTSQAKCVPNGNCIRMPPSRPQNVDPSRIHELLSRAESLAGTNEEATKQTTRGFNETLPRLVCTSRRLREYLESVRSSRKSSQNVYQFFKSVRTELAASFIFAIITSQALISLRSSWLFKIRDESEGDRMLATRQTGLSSIIGAWDQTGVQMANSFVIAFSVASLTQIFGHVSGCHLAPSVSLALYVKGHISGLRFGSYLAAQTAGPLMGLTVLSLLTSSSLSRQELDILLESKLRVSTEGTETRNGSVVKLNYRRRRQVATNTDEDELDDFVSLRTNQTGESRTAINGSNNPGKANNTNGKINITATAREDHGSINAKSLATEIGLPGVISETTTSITSNEASNDQVQIDVSETQGIETVMLPILEQAESNHRRRLTRLGLVKSHQELESPEDRGNTRLNSSSDSNARSSDNRGEIETKLGLGIDSKGSIEARGSKMRPEIESNEWDDKRGNSKHQTEGIRRGMGAVKFSVDGDLVQGSVTSESTAPSQTTTSMNTRRLVKLEPLEEPLDLKEPVKDREVGVERVQVLKKQAKLMANGKDDARSLNIQLSTSNQNEPPISNSVLISGRSLRSSDGASSLAKTRVRRVLLTSPKEIPPVDGLDLAHTSQSNQAGSIDMEGLPNSNRQEVDLQHSSRLNLLEFALPDSIMPSDSIGRCISLASQVEVANLASKEQSSGIKLAKYQANRAFSECISLPNASQMFLYQFLATLLVVLAYLVNVDPRRTDAGFRSLSIGLAYFVANSLTVSSHRW